MNNINIKHNKNEEWQKNGGTYKKMQHTRRGIVRRKIKMDVQESINKKNKKESFMLDSGNLVKFGNG